MKLDPSDPSPAASFSVIEWLLILLSFAVFASVRSPVPGVNEPHYLTKAKNFWDPAWCSRDPFLQSTNAHYVFYVTIGVLTRVFTLDQTAWIGRLLGWALLSSGWVALAGQLLPFRWGALWSAWLFLALAAIGNWSGEWVVGGIEAKVLSYACGWWSLAYALSGRPVLAAAWSGAAVSFHPVVGIWNTGAVAVALWVTDWRIWRIVPQLRWKEIAWSGLAWFALAAPGLIPAVGMLSGADKNQSYQADYIQVFHRLAHHLDPWHFSANGYWGYAGLLLLSLVLYAVSGRSARWNLVARYVVVAVLIALAGVAIRAIPDVARLLIDADWMPSVRNRLEAWVRYKPHLAGLLKFYPFRLADVVVPWVASLLVVRAAWIFRKQPATESAAVPSGPSRREILAWLASGACFATSLALPAIDRNPSRLTAEQYADWVEVCQWVQREVPRNAMCYSANDGWALKWFAHRADYLSHKDCPQDAPGIIAWNQRFKTISRWSEAHLADGFSSDELRELRRQTKIDYLISRKFGPIHLQPLYQNRTYQVYQLPD